MGVFDTDVTICRQWQQNALADCQICSIKLEPGCGRDSDVPSCRDRVRPPLCRGAGTKICPRVAHHRGAALRIGPAIAAKNANDAQKRQRR